MRLLLAAVFVTLLAPATPAIACEGEDDQISRRHDQARTARRAQRETRQARRAAERARRDLDRARRDAARAYRDAQRQPFAQPPPRPKAGPQPIDPYSDLRDATAAKDKLEKLQKKLDKLRDRLGKYQVPKIGKRAPALKRIWFEPAFGDLQLDELE